MTYEISSTKPLPDNVDYFIGPENPALSRYCAFFTADEET